MNEGVLHDVIKVMKSKGQNMTDMEKITVLCFDEIHLANRVAIERKEECVIGPHKKCQIFVARGLFSKWKQPIYYQFDQKVTTEILFDILRKLYNSGYRVVGMTCDLGPKNQGLLKCLDIDPISEGGKTFFLHPSDANLRVHVFADPPHLIKLLRNHFIDHGFTVDGQYISKDALERLLYLNSADLKIVHRLSRLHLDAQGTQRQNVKLATQIFSNTNAQAIKWCMEKSLMEDRAE